jgi:general secretion pathway protein K
MLLPPSPDLYPWHAAQVYAFSPRPFIHKGFVLVMTLWILAAITIAVGFFALWVERHLHSANEIRTELEAQIDMHSTRETLLYLFGAQRRTVGGLTLPQEQQEERKALIENEDGDWYYDTRAIGTEIRLDDRIYQGIGNIRFTLQDHDGLLEINHSSSDVLERLLGLIGIETEHRAPLLAKLKDYTDEDDFHLINGAESYHYAQAEQFPPSNRLLRVPLESARVLTWRQQTSLWQNNELEHLTTTLGSGRININTAPAQVLQAAYHFTPETVARIIAQRPIPDMWTFYQVLGVSPDDEQFDRFKIFPSLSVRLSLWQHGSQQMQRIYLRILPEVILPKRPWQIQYLSVLPLREAYRHAEAVFPHTDLFYSPTI